MTGLILILWIANVAFDTLGQIAFKYAASNETDNESMWHYWQGILRQKWLWVGIFAYIAEFFLWLAFLTLVPLSKGVLLAAMNIITIMLAGRFLFNERLIPLRVIGIAFITAGVAIVGIF